ncbi:MAG TPA: 4'-phosphopantetheinyl transferase superfamily protein [Saprospiraceae bacterium]|nr:4'-phosphopantetheinyl transferase superfamily protein [Saprospiraceae bacterium]HMQ84580.1 4'-phosphopantetheinyl transferase superfamily protein [Saprospiraceae bacterium]
MPLYLHENIEPAGELGIWQIQESEQWFLEQVDLFPEEKEQLSQIFGRRRVEWLAVRYLVHLMSGRAHRGAFIKDQYGKPHLTDSPFAISISHGQDMAAAIAAPFSVGIDIQYIVPKIERIAYKFMRPVEMDSLSQNERIAHLHVYWGAKEALYKAFGRKALDFCTHILVQPFALDWEIGKAYARVAKDDFQQDYIIFYRLLPSGHVLVTGQASDQRENFSDL